MEPIVGIEPFIKRAQTATCANMSNAIYLIDKKDVLTVQSGDCPDNGTRIELTSLASGAKICSSTSTIAGLKTECANPAMVDDFKFMANSAGSWGFVDNIGRGHVAQEVKFLPANGLSVDFKTIASDRFSGVATARNVVVRDQAALEALWAEHSATRSPAPAVPKVDFRTEMVIALFGGNDSACASFGVRRAAAVDEHLVIYYERKDPDPAMMCIAVVANPMQMIVVPRVNAVVDFVKITTLEVPFTEVYRTDYANTQGLQNYVIKDAGTMSTIWRKVTTGEAPPLVDFTKDMVVAVFGVGGYSGCFSSKIESVYREGGKLHVSSVNYSPGPTFAAACTAAFTNPVHLVKIPRSDEPVVFSSQSRYL
ncbi:hypothetical protein [Massilia genomosp. 1]|uniref:Uncharacterized protein n=1 Tax=Massilia genomosp. 1 TaxID=2609280 RepID=A0ABX0MH73_9BURK|nr:hypothetical protein [Massilia genomosp. 1]NHZ61691.1 hypothetical protein [Massilia genomosp. 1]